jgi:hypothetical protein
LNAGRCNKGCEACAARTSGQSAAKIMKKSGRVIRIFSAPWLIRGQ